MTLPHHDLPADLPLHDPAFERASCGTGFVAHLRGEKSRSIVETALSVLGRLAHRVIWVNPHKGDAPVYVPASLGMIVADPYIDEVHSGHNLASLERLAERLPKVG